MATKVSEYVWVVAYISRDNINTVQDDLLSCGMGSIKVYIPTVRILKKKFKNKNIYEYVPLLFNYGFFQIPYEKACDVEFLKKLKEGVPAIYGWVSDPTLLIGIKPNLRMDNGDSEELSEDGIKFIKRPKLTPKVAIAREEEIVSLLKTSENMSVFNDGLIEKIKEGDIINLKGYPYDGMTAEVVSISKTKKEVKVRLLLETIITTATVSFENIFYTVYNDFDKSCKEKSLEELSEVGIRRLDRIYAKISYGNEEY